jgi:hypothetical protein
VFGNHLISIPKPQTPDADAPDHIVVDTKAWVHLRMKAKSNIRRT